MIDLVAGTVRVATMTWTSALGQIRAGRIIPIAVTAGARLNEFPDLPTFSELGYDDLIAVSWFGCRDRRASARHRRAPQRRGRENAASMPTSAPAGARRDRDQGDEPEEFTRFMASEIAKWAPVAKRVMPGN